MVEMLHDHGMSISYDKALQISAQLGDATVSKHVEEGVVCPPVLRKGLFTTAVMDNIDHSLLQPLLLPLSMVPVSVFEYPAANNHGEERQLVKFGPERVESVPELPDFFTNIPPASKSKKPTPMIGTVLMPTTDLRRPHLALEHE